MSDFARNSISTAVDRYLFEKERAANYAQKDHGDAVSAAYLGAVASRVPRSNFQEELAPYFRPYTVLEMLRHPIQARRWAKAIPALGGESVKAIVDKPNLDKPNQIIRPTVILAEHASGLLLPDGRYLLPNGQITKAPINIYYDAHGTSYSNPFDKRYVGDVVGPGDYTRAEAIAWSFIRGENAFAPAVEITGDKAGEGIEDNCLYLNHLIPLINSDDCRPPLPPVPGILKGYVELG